MENVWYVLGNCIRLSAKRKEALSIDDSHVFRLAAGRSLTLGGLAIETLRSTDAGWPFGSPPRGKTFFHAGDLQWWHWEEEPKTWNEEMGGTSKGVRQSGGPPGRRGLSGAGPPSGGQLLVGFRLVDAHPGGGLGLPHAQLGGVLDHQKVQEAPLQPALPGPGDNGQSFQLEEEERHPAPTKTILRK